MCKKILSTLFICLLISFVLISNDAFLGKVSAVTEVNWLDGENTKKWEQVTAFLATCMNERNPDDEDLFNVNSDTSNPGDYLDNPDLEVILSDYSKIGGDKKIKCKDLAPTASEILFGSSDGMFRALYSQQADGTYRLKDDYLRTDVNSNDDDNQMAIKPFINTKYIDSGMATNPDSSTISFGYRTENAFFILNDHFASCFKETTDGAANALFWTENIGGNGTTYFAYIDNSSADKKFNVGTYTEDKFDGSEGIGPGDDGIWSCEEFKDKIESNKSPLGWASYTDEDVQGFAEEREAEELRESQIENITELLRQSDNAAKTAECIANNPSAPEWIKLINTQTVSELIANEMINQTGTIQWAIGNTPVEVDAVTTVAIIDCIKEAIPEIQEEINRNPDASGFEPADPSSVEEQPTCESKNSDRLDWLLCGMISGIDNIITGGPSGDGGIAGVIDDLLDIDSSRYSDPRLQQSWSYFRNIATLALVLIGLIMIIGQSVSKE